RRQEGGSSRDDERAARHGCRPQRQHRDAQGSGFGEARLRPVRSRANRIRGRREGIGGLMRRNLPLRIGIVVAVIIASAWFLYPPKKTINLGLDLQGGIHLVLGVDVDKALESFIGREGDLIRSELEKKGIGVSRIERRGSTELVVQLASPQNWTEAQNVLRAAGVFDIKESDQAAGRAVLSLRQREIAAQRDEAVRVGLETIRNRVDQFG